MRFHLGGQDICNNNNKRNRNYELRGNWGRRTWEGLEKGKERREDIFLKIKKKLLCKGKTRNCQQNTNKCLSEESDTR